jgi:hypothetical protein
MRRRLLVALFLVAFSASGRGSEAFWTHRTVSHLTLELVGDPVAIERLRFFPDGIVLVVWGQKRKPAKGEFGEVTSNPALHWRFVDGRVVIFDPATPRRSEETLTYLRREGSVLILRRISGAIGRYKMSREKV